MKKLLGAFLFVILFPAAVKAAECDLNISLKEISSERDEAVFELLKMLFSRSALTPCYDFLEVDLNRHREIQLVNSGRLSLLWASTGHEVEEGLRAVRIPIFKGLTGYRLLVVRSGDLARFADVKTPDDLRKLRVGVGETWGDRLVFEAARLPVTLTAFSNMWVLLESERFDYFTLGLHEPWFGLSKYEGDLAVVPELMIAYRMATYFYVSGENEELYQLLLSTMEAAIDDGAYDALFHRIDMIQRAAIKAKPSSRHTIYLSNPHMPDDTPIRKQKYWIDMESFEAEVKRANNLAE